MKVTLCRCLDALYHMIRAFVSHGEYKDVLNEKKYEKIIERQNEEQEKLITEHRENLLEEERKKRLYKGKGNPQ